MPVDKDLIPCVVFAFNRPEKLHRILSALKAQGIDRLIVFVDGPRNKEDINLIEQCRTIARKIDWVDKDLHFGEQNRGLPGLNENINTVLKIYKAAVFVEDDCLPMPGFYSFMKRALNHYEDEKTVFSIGGYQPIRERHFKRYRYSLVSTARFLAWGWATWQDRWERIAPYLPRYWELFDGLTNVPDIGGSDLAIMAQNCAQGKDKTWEIKIAISTLYLGQVHLVTIKGLVRNIGVEGGVHGGRDKKSVRRSQGIQNNNVYEGSVEHIEWLDNVDLNSDYVERIKRFVKDATRVTFTRRIENRLRQWPLAIKSWRLLHRIKAKLFNPHPERLYDLVLQQKGGQPLTKRALLSYIVHPFCIEKNDPKFLSHSNIWCAHGIVRVLNQLGYTVDVIVYTDTSFVPLKEYDLFIGHGGINFENIAKHIKDSATKIYFSTGCYWKFHNEEEAARFSALRKRKGVYLPLDRSIRNSEEGALLAADGIIGIGNSFTRKTYNDFSPVIMLNNPALYDNHYDRCEKDYDRGRKHFLYFAGSGCVHKGLDLLLESFLGLKEHLWICTTIDQRFADVYSDELYNHPNVHLIGWIQPHSEQFYDLVDTCNYVILPSCSEGQAHSVVECMNQGLIPIVSRACGLDVNDYGVILDPCNIEEISRVVQRLSSYSSAQCHEMSMRARQAAVNDFSEHAFIKNMKKSIQNIIAHKTTQKEANHKPVSSKGIIIEPLFIDKDRNILVDCEAVMNLQSKNDRRYFQEGQGIVKVSIERWEEAQGYERRTWMEGDGLRAQEDRNIEHERHFKNYSAIQGMYFNNAIEIGCGPFTNMVLIRKHVKCGNITLLDPLITSYLTHPHCKYKRNRLGGLFGERVQTVDEQIESFYPDEIYDLVVVVNVLEHCCSSSKVFERIVSLTAPQGIIVFHDKLISASILRSFVHNIYDAGHPLRIADNLILEFLSKNYSKIFQKNVPISAPHIGKFDSIYFIGRKLM